MVWGCVAARRGRALALVGMMGVVASVSVLASSPAEAARRHHRRAPAYNPPFAAMVVDMNSGRTLFARNEDEPRIPASLTKVMTLYLLFEQLESGRMSLDTPLSVSAYAADQAPSKLGLRPGSTIDVEDAIKAVVTKSANDVAVAIAENIAGSEDKFAQMMTAKARALGMSRTTFHNANGLPSSPPNLTTARDLTILGRAIQERFPRYYAYFQTRSFRYAGRTIVGHNRILDRVEGADGIKTGYTRASGFNLLTSVKANGRSVVAAVLGGRSAAQRDNMMADLIDENLPRAYAGGRTTQSVAVAAARPEPEEEPANVVAASDTPAEAPSDMTASLPVKPAVTKPMDLAGIRPVVASASGVTATPSTTLRWNAGPQPAKVEKQETKARAEKVEPSEQKPAKTTQAVATSAEPKSQPSEIKLRHPAGWVIQLGATEAEDQARDILDRAKSRTRGVLSKASPFTEKIVKDGTTLYRARFSGFDPDSAQAACKALKQKGFSCFATRG